MPHSAATLHVLAVLNRAFPDRKPGISDAEFIHEKTMDWMNKDIATKSLLEAPKGTNEKEAKRYVRMASLYGEFISVESGAPPKTWRKHYQQAAKRNPELPSSREMRQKNLKNRNYLAALQRELVEAEGPFQFVIGVPPKALRQMQEERLERMWHQSPHTPSFGQGCD